MSRIWMNGITRIPTKSSPVKNVKAFSYKKGALTATKYALPGVGVYATLNLHHKNRAKQAGCYVHLLGRQRCRLLNRSCNAVKSEADCDLSPTLNFPNWLSLPHSPDCEDGICDNCSINALVNAHPKNE